MNSDEFKLIFGSDTESEDYIFAGFSGKDLIMADTDASSKKHSRSKDRPPRPLCREMMWKHHRKSSHASGPA